MNESRMNDSRSTDSAPVLPWTDGVDRGAWLHERLAPHSQRPRSPARNPHEEALAAIVPTGFPALVLVPHRRPTDNTAAEAGNLDAETLASVAAVLSAHTATPDEGIAGVWDGYGGLVSSGGRAVLSVPQWGVEAAADLVELTRQALFTEPAAPGSGVLSEAAATGPRLKLPDRDYILFEAGVVAFTDPAWPQRAPWIDDASWVQSPNVLWPAGREWFLVSEIDLAATLIACSEPCAVALLGLPAIGAERITRDTWVW